MRVPETRESLLVRVRDADDQLAWEEFSAIYRPAVFRLARRRGLQDADAEDVAQHVLMIVAKAVENWQQDPSRGKFRNWLFCVARNAITNALTRRKPDAAVGGSSYLQKISMLVEPNMDAAQLADSLSKYTDIDDIAEFTSAEIESEYRRGVFRFAAQQTREQFREETWAAFWLTAVEGIPAQDVAARLGKSVGTIYTARSRVMQAIRACVARLIELDD